MGVHLGGLGRALWKATALAFTTQGLGAQTRGNRWIKQTARGSAGYQWGNYEWCDKQLSQHTSCLAPQHLSLKRGKKETKPPITDTPPWASLTKTSLIGGAVSLGFGYSCPFSPLPTSQWMLYPYWLSSFVLRARLFHRRTWSKTFLTSSGRKGRLQMLGDGGQDIMC